jgi:hypothetical protein
MTDQATRKSARSVTGQQTSRTRWNLFYAHISRFIGIIIIIIIIIIIFTTTTIIIIIIIIIVVDFV